MEQFQSFDAILIPADGRAPHLVKLLTSPASFATPYGPLTSNDARMAHPEVHMEYIAKDVPGAWDYQACPPLPWGLYFT